MYGSLVCAPLHYAQVLGEFVGARSPRPIGRFNETIARKRSGGVVAGVFPLDLRRGSMIIQLI